MRAKLIKQVERVGDVILKLSLYHTHCHTSPRPGVRRSPSVERMVQPRGDRAVCHLKQSQFGANCVTGFQELRDFSIHKFNQVNPPFCFKFSFFAVTHDIVKFILKRIQGSRRVP